MVSFGKKLRECREAKGFSQQQLAKKLDSAHTVIGRYERDEMIPSIDVVRKLADALDTTVGFLLGEANDTNILKDPKMMKRLNEINELPIKIKSLFTPSWILSLLNPNYNRYLNSKAWSTDQALLFICK